MISAIIFDMDGVLVDNKEVHVRAFEIFARRYGLDYSSEDLKWSFGMGNDEIMPRLFPVSLIEQKGIQALADEKEQIYRDIFEETITPSPGLIDFLESARSKGLRRAVGSSGSTANVEYVLEKCGITDYFETFASGDMVEHAKPDPAVFLLAAEKLGVRPSECLVIEDAFAGIEAARKAGMRVIAITSTYTRSELEKSDAERIVSGFVELNEDFDSVL